MLRTQYYVVHYIPIPYYSLSVSALYAMRTQEQAQAQEQVTSGAWGVSSRAAGRQAGSGVTAEAQKVAECRRALWASG